MRRFCKERRVIRVERVKNAAPPRKRVNCLRERGEVMEEGEGVEEWSEDGVEGVDNCGCCC